MRVRVESGHCTTRRPGRTSYRSSATSSSSSRRGGCSRRWSTTSMPAGSAKSWPRCPRRSGGSRGSPTAGRTSPCAPPTSPPTMEQPSKRGVTSWSRMGSSPHPCPCHARAAAPSGFSMWERSATRRAPMCSLTPSPPFETGDMTSMSKLSATSPVTRTALGSRPAPLGPILRALSCSPAFSWATTSGQRSRVPMCSRFQPSTSAKRLDSCSSKRWRPSCPSSLHVGGGSRQSSRLSARGWSSPGT